MGQELGLVILETAGAIHTKNTSNISLCQILPAPLSSY